MKNALLGSALLVALLSGCGPNWKVVKVSGPPSALAAANDVVVAFDYSKMFVEGRTEAEWVATKTGEDAKYPETWADLKGRFEAAVIEGVRSQFPSAHHVNQGGGQVVMVMQVRDFKMGKFIPFALPPTVMSAEILFQVGGQTTDEISLVRSYPSSITQPSVFNHIGPVGQALGTAGGQLLVSKKGN